jgi:hypothetical protein
MILNPKAAVRVEVVAGAIPVLYIEDFYLDPDDVRAEGLSASFDQSLAYYPGRHAPLTTPAAEAAKQHLCQILTAVGDRVFDPGTTITDFSILTTRARDLLGKQKHPHIDPTPVLGLVYLNPHTTSGTCLFYNRVLGMHTVLGEEAGQKLTSFLDEQGPTYEPDDYDLTGNACWQKIYTIEGRFNRCVVYPGNVFHSIDIKDVPETFDINTARLTQRFIVHRADPKPV